MIVCAHAYSHAAARETSALKTICFVWEKRELPVCCDRFVELCTSEGDLPVCDKRFVHLSKNFRNVMDCLSKSVFALHRTAVGFQWLSELFHVDGADLTEVLSVFEWFY